MTPTPDDMKIIVRLAGSIRRAAKERPAVNDFFIRPTQLHEEYGGPPPITVGYHLHHNWKAVQAALGLVGLRIIENRPVRGGKLLRIEKC